MRQAVEQLQLEILGTDIAWSSRWIYAPKYSESESNQSRPWGQEGIRQGRKEVSDFSAGVSFGGGLPEILQAGRQCRHDCVITYRVAWRCHRRRCRPCPWSSLGRWGFSPSDRSPWRCAPTSSSPVDTRRPEKRIGCQLAIPQGPYFHYPLHGQALFSFEVARRQMREPRQNFAVYCGWCLHFSFPQTGTRSAVIVTHQALSPQTNQK